MDTSMIAKPRATSLTTQSGQNSNRATMDIDGTTPLPQRYAKDMQQHVDAFRAAHPVDKEDGPVGADVAEHGMVVCSRIRPLLPQETAAGHVEAVTALPGGKVIVHSFREGTNFRTGAKRLVVTDKPYDVDLAFGPGASTDAVFDKAIAPVVELACAGGIGTVLAYGQTGAGKTYTMQGLMQRVAVEVFAADQPTRHVYLSVVEQRGVDVTDILHDRTPVDVREDVMGAVVLQGMREVPVTTAAELLAATAAAAEKRQTHATAKNATSSRTHLLTRLRIVGPAARPASPGGMLVLVDLAGSERRADSQLHDDARFEETKLINTSLLNLKECVRARAGAGLTSKVVHVPYRNDKLTLMLKEVFDLSSRIVTYTVVIAALSPSMQDARHTIGTAAYALPFKLAAVEARKHAAAMRRGDKGDAGMNPIAWSHERLRLHVRSADIDPDLVCPNGESGCQMVRVPQAEFVGRLEKAGMSEKQADVFYKDFWELVVIARTEQRRRAMPRQGKVGQTRKDALHLKKLSDKYQICVEEKAE